jgi:hypothetical protein
MQNTNVIVDAVPTSIVAALLADRIEELASELSRAGDFGEGFLGVLDSSLVAAVLSRQCDSGAGIIERLARAGEADGTSLSVAESESVAALLRSTVDTGSPLPG